MEERWKLFNVEREQFAEEKKSYGEQQLQRMKGLAATIAAQELRINSQDQRLALLENQKTVVSKDMEECQSELKLLKEHPSLVRLDVAETGILVQSLNGLFNVTPVTVSGVRPPPTSQGSVLLC